jgi:hypothetical protein
VDPALDVVAVAAARERCDGLRHMNAPELSVILCTHNPRNTFLAETLAGLRAQTLSMERWELLVVDNASDAPLAPDLAWHPRAQIVREDRVGLTFARLCGFRAAAGGLFVLVDDDNVLAPDYLAVALDLALKWPLLGAWGGQCRGRFEREPESWTREYWHLLGIREFAQDMWSNVLGINQPVPIGAGMCVCRAVAERYMELLHRNPKRAALDRASDQLMSCGDTDLALTSCDLGLGTGLFTALQLTHLMPARRLEEDYLRELARGIAYSEVILASFRNRQPYPRSRTQRLLKWWESQHLRGRERDFTAIVESARDEALADIPKYRAT